VTVSPADRIYRALLRLLPADFREECAADMTQLFRDHRRAAGGRPLRLAGLWAAAIADIVSHSISIRRERRALARAAASTNRSTPMRTFLGDFRHGFRLLRRHPATSIVAVLTLAVGIGANAAMFSVVDPVLLRPLPYPEPDRLVMVWEKRAREGVFTNVVSPADYLDWRRMNTVFQEVAAITEAGVTLTGDGQPEQLIAGVVSPSFFSVLGIDITRGRGFTADDEVVGQHRVIVISDRFWQRRFGGDPGVLGRALTINSGPTPWRIVGVLPRGFQFSTDYDLYVPLTLEAPGAVPTRVSHYLEVYARLKPDVTMAQAVESMDRLGQQLETEHPDANRGHGSHVTPMREQFVGSVRDRLLILSAAVGLVLLIACTNVASLMLARAAARRREMAVRAALGANRRRLIAQSLAESLSVSVLGAAAGIALGALIMEMLPHVLPERLSVVGLESLALDLRVLAFVAILAVGTAVLFGLWPAIQASRLQPAESAVASARGPVSVKRWSRHALVIGEVTLASVTLVGAGLVVRSFQTTLQQPLGFEPHDVLTTGVSLPSTRYTPDARRIAMIDLETRLRAIAGVTEVGAIDMLPLSGFDGRNGMQIEGREPSLDEPPIRVHPRVVTPGYFAALRIPIVAGRPFSAADAAQSEPVVIINEAARRRYWPGADPIGQRVSFGGNPTMRRVIGVAKDVRHWGMTADVNPMLYWPQSQANAGSLVFVVRSTLAEPAIRGAVKGVIGGFDANLATEPRMFDDVVAESLRAERALALLMGGFAVLALLLAVVGIYGVTANVVQSRVPEIGLRMTLGARPRDIVRQILGEGLAATAAGLAVGLGAGVALMNLAEAVLFGVTPWDPVTLVGVSIVLLAAAAAACLIPARRALRVDPVQSLRQG
jgi:putative ABC transport system permease protein